MDAISVCIRIRPLDNRELQNSSNFAWLCEKNNVVQIDSQGKPCASPFTFDYVLDDKCSNQQVYDSAAKEIVLSALDGINGTVFAYGQTSSGKTFTMQGNESHPGIIPLALREVFDRIKQTPDREYLLRMSYLEIYNEVIRDLLTPGSSNLKIHETPAGIYLGNLREEMVTSASQVIDFLAFGEKHRHVSSTNMNEHSSRSHTIFRMMIESRERGGAAHTDENAKPNHPKSTNGCVRMACLYLVDLAGSERASQTGAEGLRLREGGHINKSLLTLERVIRTLSDAKMNAHIPYRDSKLTRILSTSLGGNSKTAIICTITPASMHVDESTSTLQFASRAKKIRNKPEVNEFLDDQAMIRRFKEEIANLRRQLEDSKNNDEMLKKLLVEKDQALLAKQEVQQKLLVREANLTAQKEKLDVLSKQLAEQPTTVSMDTSAFDSAAAQSDVMVDMAEEGELCDGWVDGAAFIEEGGADAPMAMPVKESRMTLMSVPMMHQTDMSSYMSRMSYSLSDRGSLASYATNILVEASVQTSPVRTPMKRELAEETDSPVKHHQILGDDFHGQTELQASELEQIHLDLVTAQQACADKSALLQQQEQEIINLKTREADLVREHGDLISVLEEELELVKKQTDELLTDVKNKNMTAVQELEVEQARSAALVAEKTQIESQFASGLARRDERISMLETVVMSHETTACELRKELANSQQLLSAYEQEIDGTRTNASSLACQLSDVSMECSRLREEIQTADAKHLQEKSELELELRTKTESILMLTDELDVQVKSSSEAASEAASTLSAAQAESARYKALYDEASEQLVKMETEHKELRAEVNLHCDELIKDLQTRANALEAELVAAQSTQANLQYELNSALESAKNSLKETEAAKEMTAQVTDSMAQKLLEKDQEIAEIETNLRMSENKLNELRAKAAQLEERSKQLEDDMSVARASADKYKQESETLSASLAETQEANATLLARMNQEESAYRSQIDDFKAQLTSSLSKVESLSRTSDKAKTEYDALVEEKTALEDRLDELIRKEEVAREKLSTATEEVDILRARCDKQAAEVERLSKLESDYKATRQAKTDLEEEMRTLQEQLEPVLVKASEDAEAREKAENLLKSSMEAIWSMESKQKSSEEYLSRTRQSLADATAENERLAAEVVSLKAMSVPTDEDDAVKAQLADACAQQERLSTDLEQAVARCASLVAENKKLETDLQAAQTKTETAETPSVNVSQLQSNLADAIAQREAVEKELASLKKVSEAKPAETASKAELKQVEDKLSEQKSKIDELTTNLKDKDNLLMRYKEKAAEQLVELSRMKSKLATQESYVTEFSEKYSSSVKTVEALKQSLAAKTHEYEDLLRSLATAPLVPETKRESPAEYEPAEEVKRPKIEQKAAQVRNENTFNAPPAQAAPQQQQATQPPKRVALRSALRQQRTTGDPNQCNQQ